MNRQPPPGLPADFPLDLDLDRDEDLLVAVALWAEGEPDLVEPLQAAFTARDPDSLGALVGRAAGMGMDFNAFVQAATLLLPPAPTHEAAWRAIAAAAPRDTPPAVLYNLGLDLRTAVGAADAAASLYRAALAADPLDPDLWLELGRASEDLGDDRGALSAWRQAATLAPDDPRPWADCAWLLTDRQRLPEALAAVDEALARSRDPDLLHARGQLLLRTGQPDAGRDALTAAVDAWTARLADGDDADALFWRAAARARLGDSDHALLDLHAAARLDPDLAARARDEDDFATLPAARLDEVLGR